MSDRRVFHWATTSTRLLAGTAVSAVAAVAVVTAVSVPWPTLTREPLSISTLPAPSASVASWLFAPPATTPRSIPIPSGACWQSSEMSVWITRWRTGFHTARRSK